MRQLHYHNVTIDIILIIIIIIIITINNNSMYIIHITNITRHKLQS